MPTPAYLAALLLAKADDDADTVEELKSLLADPEHAQALLEQAEGDDGGEVVVKSQWDESKHPRDHGKFSSKPGSAGDENDESEKEEVEDVAVEFDDDPQPGDVDPSSLEPVNETIPEKVQALAKLMKDRGWDGPPLIAVGDQALTGSHRLAAAQLAGLETVPVIVIDGERFRIAAESAGLVDGEGEVRLRDDEDTLIVLKKMGFYEYSDVLMTMSDEVDNNRAYGGEQWRRAAWVDGD